MTTSGDAESVMTTRRYDGMVNQFRLELLEERLAHSGPLDIVYWNPGFSYDRTRLVLGDRTALRLKLYWPCRHQLLTLHSVTWRDDAWRLDVGIAASERVTLHAFSATVV